MHFARRWCHCRSLEHRFPFRELNCQISCMMQKFVNHPVCNHFNIEFRLYLFCLLLDFSLTLKTPHFFCCRNSWSKAEADCIEGEGAIGTHNAKSKSLFSPFYHKKNRRWIFYRGYLAYLPARLSVCQKKMTYETTLRPMMGGIRSHTIELFYSVKF
jgi:hypothetical protein